MVNRDGIYKVVFTVSTMSDWGYQYDTAVQLATIRPAEYGHVCIPVTAEAWQNMVWSEADDSPELRAVYRLDDRQWSQVSLDDINILIVLPTAAEPITIEYPE